MDEYAFVDNDYENNFQLEKVKAGMKTDADPIELFLILRGIQKQPLHIKLALLDHLFQCFIPLFLSDRYINTQFYIIFFIVKTTLQELCKLLSPSGTNFM